MLKDWRGFWARKNQIQPGGDWTHWLVLAGRGFGKTRTGAETVREWASRPLPGPIHLIAPTAADIRKVMIEGPEGGLLSCYPVGQRPLYEPSKGHLLTWANGNVGYCFSADEPERLRGPQCIAEGTAILDGNGSTKPIEAVISGDFVMTRRGPRRVMRAWMADRNADVSRLRLLDGRSIIATGDHPVCVTRASNTKDLLGTRNQGIATIRRGSSCTERFGRPSADPSHQNTTFITLTEISTIIGSRIWNSSLAANTTGFTVERSLTPIRTSPWRPPSWRPKETGLSASLPESLRVSSAVPTIVAGLSGQRPSVPLPALRECGPVPSLARIEFANTVPARIARQSDSSAIAVESAMPQRAHLDLSSQGALYALTAPSHSRHAEVMDDSAVGHAPWPFMTEIVSVSACGQAPVYDLEIEGEHEFFANGILVHNCCRYWADELATWRFGQEAWDNLMFGFRLGDQLRGVITTTPKPIKLLKSIMSDTGTVTTRGSTYDNRNNLSQQFFKSVITKYEGTRLGRQELNAELLDDVPGALWKMNMIDSTRISLGEVRWDRIIRIVVAIDPSVTSGPDSNETGIVVAGLTISNHVIILDDLSCKDTPRGWGTIAVNAYLSRRADHIIGEVNNGGDLVEANIRAVNANVPYHGVHASRGKRRRAEPVAALYEQGRVHHVGTFPELEQQMCGYVPGVDLDGQSDSPDRMDAMVWAVTELVIEPIEASMTITLAPPGGYQISPI